MKELIRSMACAKTGDLPQNRGVETCQLSFTPCLGKQKYDDPQSAHRAARERNRKAKRAMFKGQFMGHVSAYRCADCGCWHIGRSKLKKRKA